MAAGAGSAAGAGAGLGVVVSLACVFLSSAQAAWLPPAHAFLIKASAVPVSLPLPAIFCACCAATLSSWPCGTPVVVIVFRSPDFMPLVPLSACCCSFAARASMSARAPPFLAPGLAIFQSGPGSSCITICFLSGESLNAPTPRFGMFCCFHARNSDAAVLLAS